MPIAISICCTSVPFLFPTAVLLRLGNTSLKHSCGFAFELGHVVPKMHDLEARGFWRAARRKCGLWSLSCRRCACASDEARTP